MGSECKGHQPQDDGGVAPFVAKTFHMVSDPATDAVVCWGGASNTFLVLDPAAFSDFLLPSYFKHRNFASFVRQLNTYGFRKVDPDVWEFAHESFLRGQAKLLPLIVRKKKRAGAGAAGRELCEEEEEVRGTIQAVQRLRDERRGMEEELQAMDRRLRAAENRPGQMMAFLASSRTTRAWCYAPWSPRRRSWLRPAPVASIQARIRGGGSGPTPDAELTLRIRRPRAGPCRSPYLIWDRCSTDRPWEPRVDR
uniref:Heat stress transcription factor C-1b n=1 Tax=Aegilops tauschii TaxID=37682 RepID=M8BIZ3_AEGTA